jgi:hypothetical protein
MVAYAVLGHSGTNRNGTIEVVPANVTLVFLTACLRVYQENNIVLPMFKNQNLLNSFLNNIKPTNSNYVKSIKRIREVYPSNTPYQDYSISMPTTNGMLHGVYNLPRNFNTQNRSNALFGTRNNKRIKLSEVLGHVSGRGGGVVFAAICRSMPGVLSLEPRHINNGRPRSPHKVRHPVTGEIRRLPSLPRYTGLRKLKHRKPYMYQIATALRTARNLPQPNRTVTRIPVPVPPSLKVILKIKKPPVPKIRFVYNPNK